MQQQGIEFQEQYTADGVDVELQLQVHQIPELADKFVMSRADVSNLS